VHRDIKPGNILLAPDGGVKVTDFGIARYAGASGLTMAGAFIGTADYAAPEQAGGETDTRSDIYSLGATLYCMLAGHPPFQAPTAWQVLSLHQSAEPPGEPLAHLPPGVVNPIRRCLEKDPRDRYQTPTELAGALERALSSYTRRHDLRPRPGQPGAAAPAAPITGPTHVAGAPQGLPPVSAEPTRVTGAHPPGPPYPTAGTSAPLPPAYEIPLPPPRERRGTSPGVLVAIGAAVVAVAAIAAFVLLRGGDDSTKNAGTGAPTVPAGASATVPPLRATALPTAVVPTATPPAVPPTPTPAPPTPTTVPPLPTPVIAGFPTIPLPATSPEREIVDAVNRNGPAYSAAINRRDESLLTGVFTGEALTQYTKDVQDERAKPQPTQNTLLSIDLVTLQPGASAATVTTKERWRVFAGSTCTEYSYDETYQLVFGSGLWKVAKNPFVRTSMRAC
jgi:serine/threonine-protein kinase